MFREKINRILSLRDETGKFSKGEAYYISDAHQKPFRCANCVHYQGRSCRIVSSEGPPSDGKISAHGACSLYNARAPRIQALQMMWGRGELDGVAPQTARATAFTLTYAALGEDMPDDMKEKTLFSPEELSSFIPR